jgi:hypothetical protein
VTPWTIWIPSGSARAQREVEALVKKRHGNEYLNDRRAKTELAHIDRDLRRLKVETAALEERKAKLIDEIAKQGGHHPTHAVGGNNFTRGCGHQCRRRPMISRLSSAIRCADFAVVAAAQRAGLASVETESQRTVRHGRCSATGTVAATSAVAAASAP